MIDRRRFVGMGALALQGMKRVLPDEGVRDAVRHAAPVRDLLGAETQRPRQLAERGSRHGPRLASG